MGRTPPIFRPSYSGRAGAVHAWGFGSPFSSPFSLGRAAHQLNYAKEYPTCCHRWQG